VNMINGAMNSCLPSIKKIYNEGLSLLKLKKLLKTVFLKFKSIN